MKNLIRKISFAGIFILTRTLLFGQNIHFTKSGVIEYERTINTFVILKKQISRDNEAIFQPIYDQYVRDKPQFKKSKSILRFSEERTLFEPVPEPTSGSNFLENNAMLGQYNSTYIDFRANAFISERQVFEKLLLVKDSIKQIHWKITNETREIAGYSCRRANAIVLDSIYVVAFYSDQIPVSGGPESFNGLPGMILGLAIPHENITWFATKVTDISINAKEISPPASGEKIDNVQLQNILQSTLKNKQSYGNEILKLLSM